MQGNSFIANLLCFARFANLYTSWVSISSEVGADPIKVGGSNTSVAVRPLALGGSREEHFGI